MRWLIRCVSVTLVLGCGDGGSEMADGSSDESEGLPPGVGVLGLELEGLYEIVSRDINQTACEPGGAVAAGFPMLVLAVRSAPSFDLLVAASCLDEAACEQTRDALLAGGPITADLHQHFDRPAGSDSLSGTTDAAVLVGDVCRRQVDEATVVRTSEDSFELEVLKWRSEDFPVDSPEVCKPSAIPKPDVSLPCHEHEGLLAQRITTTL